ncbi:GNAT family N-acetyltransferase [Rhodobacterales bacterium 59_46_T64]|nr:GNAT family N-acetyltransferase [Rhodobacterales bacterium 59_46_T64]
MVMQMTDQPVIEAERCTLRPLRMSDKGLIDLYASDERVAMNTTSVPHPLPPGTTDAFIARSLSAKRSEDVWVMDATKSGGAELKGLISLERVDDDQCEIGYWVAPAFWNTGVASRAVAALLEANPLNCRTCFASVFQDNAASARVLTNCGFEYIGDAETFSVARNAKVAIWTYSRTFG